MCIARPRLIIVETPFNIALQKLSLFAKGFSAREEFAGWEWELCVTFPLGQELLLRPVPVVKSLEREIKPYHGN